MTRPLRILLVGGESAGAETFKAVRRSPHELLAVLTSPPRGRTGASGLATLAQKGGVPVMEGRLVKDPAFAAWIAEQRVDLLLNVHSLFLVRPEVLAAPAIGCFNLHPGPLPRSAGLNVPSWAIFLGEPSHGVTLHWMAKDLDDGPIAFQSEFPIEPADTGLSVALKCVRRGIPLIEELLKAAEAGGVPRLPQDLRERRYFRAGPPEDGLVSWAWPARKVLDFVRACDYRPFPSPWGHPGMGAPFGDVHVVAARATGRPADAPPGRVGAVTREGVEVACADEWVLVRDVEVGGRPAGAAEVLGNVRSDA
jgi:methionyl-tRNA formyltransferase